jgi:predicted esterase
MVPLKLQHLPNRSGVAVLLAASREDSVVPPENTKQFLLFEQAGADVAEYWQGGGHELSPSAVEAAYRWLSQLFEQLSQHHSKKGSQ